MPLLNPAQGDALLPQYLHKPEWCYSSIFLEVQTAESRSWAI